MTAERYPRGVDLVGSGLCPIGGASPMACMVCEFGHMLECHFPFRCREAECCHSLAPDGANLDPEEMPAFCLGCGCSELDPCIGGCAWSEYFARRGQPICTNCAPVLICTEVNLSALQLWRANLLTSFSEVTHESNS